MTMCSWMLPAKPALATLQLLLALTTMISPLVAVAGDELVVHGAMDRSAMSYILRAFRAANPGVEVSYREHNTNPLYREFLEAVEAGRPTADLLLSSAMDLQTKLAN